MLKTLTLATCALALSMPLARAADDDPAAAAAVGRDVAAAVYGASFKDMRDEMKSLAPYKGKTLILYQWALWCAPCQHEAAELTKMRRAIGDRNIALVAIAMSNGDDVRRFVAEHGIDYTMLYGGSNAMALGTALGNPSSGVPFFAIVRDGVLIRAFHGDRTPDELVALAEGTAGH